MHGPRAVAIVVRGRQVLVIKRHYRGHEYAVLPGGSVEPGESRGGRDCRGRSWRSAARTTASSCCGPAAMNSTLWAYTPSTFAAIYRGF